MDWTYFVSKRFQVSEFQREAATKPVVVPMSKAATIAVKAKRGTETRVADIKRLLSQITRQDRYLPPHACNALPHALLKIAR